MEVDAKSLEQVMADLPLAIEGWRAEATTLGEVDDLTAGIFLNTELNGYMKITGGGWLPEQRLDWVNQAYALFEGVPFMMLEESVQRAVRLVWDPKRFVSWIFEDIAKRAARLEEEGRILRTLAKAAGI